MGSEQKKEVKRDKREGGRRNQRQEEGAKRGRGERWV